MQEPLCSGMGPVPAVSQFFAPCAEIFYVGFFYFFLCRLGDDFQPRTAADSASNSQDGRRDHRDQRFGMSIHVLELHARGKTPKYPQKNLI